MSTPSPTKKVVQTKAARKPAKPLHLTKVGTEPIVEFKRFVVKESSIAGAGKGLFLMEAAKDGEKIARYSGRLLSKAEAEASESDYIVQVTTSKFLDGASEDEWEG